MIKMEKAWRDLINNSFKDRMFCLVGTASLAGEPQISPKGSVCVYDDATLAYWERARRSSLERLQEIINGVTVVQKVRRPTRPSKGAKQKRLDNKTHRGKTKALRGRVPE